ncbi:MAG: hypothetical protein ACI9J3_000037 [Parvicellaceae bacterium]|jgi:hypothetical protein
MDYLSIGDPSIPSFSLPVKAQVPASNNNAIWWVIGGAVVIGVIGYLAYHYAYKIKTRTNTTESDI